MSPDNNHSIQSAFILNRRPYRETSLLLEVFTSGAGRVGLVAKGARRGKSPLSAILEPFRSLLISWRGRGELFTLTQAEAQETTRLPRIWPVKSGFYVNELLLRLLQRHDPHPELFQDYRQVLTRILIPEEEEIALRIFEKRLLAAIGYGLSLDRDALSGSPLAHEKHYHYQPNLGFTENEDHAPPAGGSTIIVQGGTLIALNREEIHGTLQLREAKRLMRIVLGQYLGEKPLASRMLYRQRS